MTTGTCGGDSMMTPRALPSGLVTFVMTDIEGWTKMFRRLGDVYPQILDVHDRLLREQWNAYRGSRGEDGR